MATIKTLPLDDVRFDGETQMRAGLDGDTVQDYRGVYESGAEMPPAVVYFDGAAYWLADGFHRWHARHEMGLHDIKCEVHKGSQRDAIWHAAGANTSHGLRRTNEDKHKAVRFVLSDAEWSKLSDRQIAEHVGVSQPFVGKIREQVITVITCESRQSSRRTGADGKSYPAVPKHAKPTPKEADEPKPDAAKQSAPVDDEPEQADGDCPKGGEHIWRKDKHGGYCEKCFEPAEKDVTKSPSPKSTIISRCEQFWSTLNETERRVAFGWFQEQLG